MKSEIAEFLICPRCLPSETDLMLEAHDSDGGEVVNGTLRCPQCRTEYPIAEGIAALLPEPPELIPIGIWLDGWGMCLR